MTQSDDFAKAIGFACMMADFQNGLISRILVFFQAVFCTEQLITFRIDFDMFLGILIFDPKWRFFKGFACMVADFQNGLISRILGVFSSGFLHRSTLNHF